MDKQRQDDVFVRKWKRQASCSPRSACAGLYTAQQALTGKFYNVFHYYVSFFSQQIVNNIPMDVCNIIKSRKADSLLSLFVKYFILYLDFFNLKYTGVTFEPVLYNINLSRFLL